MPEDILTELYGYEFTYPIEETAMSIHNQEELQYTDNEYIL